MEVEKVEKVELSIENLKNKTARIYFLDMKLGMRHFKMKFLTLCSWNFKKLKYVKKKLGSSRNHKFYSFRFSE